ncbi:SDR family NAD(P)-dependent oxidoreductase [Aquisphaera insulae]|uniref:SDR family NAD(P)-dependent oxidoreductase n=1 Tax=Aquisphaera insulae TaxID=2712864 RepID=UPI0013EB8F17|nr:SDR family oxidoreductase [Aquisphaera insulae]
MDRTLAGKTAVITGAGSGIGRATVLRFLTAGASVVAVDRRPDLAEALAADVPAGSRDRLAAVVGDIATEDPAREFTRVALDRFGGLDILINNAGISVVKPLHEHTPEEWDSVMNTNVKGIYWSARHVVPVMIARGGGLILNTGSISGEAGIPGQGAYAASKGAIHQMTRQMAIEYAPHKIRVNAVGCGTVDTPLVRWSAEKSGDPDAFWKMLREGHPIGRIASPEEVADFYVYLAGDAASFFTGAILMLDGGYTAR